MLKIEEVQAREILDGRGWPTVQVTVRLSDGSVGRAAAASGLPGDSLGGLELRDGDARRYNGMGVLKALQSVEQLIAPALKKTPDLTQRGIDKLLCRLDGTPNMAHLGANATLPVSVACARALAAHCGMPLYRFLGGANAHRVPVPMMCVLKGGAKRQRSMDFREFLLTPTGADSFREGLRCCAEVFRCLQAELERRGFFTGEVCPAPALSGDEEAVEIILQAAEKAGYGGRIKLALNADAQRWVMDEHYRLPGRSVEYSTEELIAYWEIFTQKYPVVSLIDPLGPEDFEGWAELTARLGERVQLLGGELFACDPERLRQGMDEGAANAVLVEPGRLSTLTDILDFVDLARRGGIKPVITCRPGETADSFPADLAVAVNAGQIKLDAPCRAEQTEKCNRLLEVEDSGERSH